MYAIVVAPLHEELYFRGVLFRAVRDRYGLVSGLLATGFGFALVHFLDAEWQDALLLMGVMFFNGMALGWWYERRGTIVAPVVAQTYCARAWKTRRRRATSRPVVSMSCQARSRSGE